jgi:hypothetical protein
MLEFKIYSTITLTLLLIASATWSLMDYDTVREDLWYKVASASWTLLGLMVIGGPLYFIWFVW